MALDVHTKKEEQALDWISKNISQKIAELAHQGSCYLCYNQEGEKLEGCQWSH